MKNRPLLSRLTLVAICLLTSVWTSAAVAVEPYLEFAARLREKEYFDTAIEYLEWAEKQASTPADVKEILSYEKARTLMEAARGTRNPEKSLEYLERARGFFEEFVKASPNHALAGMANTELANVLVQKAKVAVIQSRSPSNAAKKATFQADARALFGQARTVFQAARDLAFKRWDAFPKYIDKTKEPELFEQRAQAELAYIKAQLDLALVNYEESQTWDEGTAEYKKALTDAANEFAELHKKYRSQVAGLYARLYQGKCFEEQEDLQKAMGIYNELLSHEGNSDAMQKLQDQVRQYHLIVLNKRKDWQLVIQEADEWLKKHPPPRDRTKVAYGIRWEIARAQEAFASNTEGMPDPDRTRLLRQALENANRVNKGPAEYRDVSQSMISRLNVAIKGKDAEPTDFDTAYGLSRLAVEKIKTFKDDLAAAPDQTEKQKRQADLDLHLQDTSRLLRLGIVLAQPDTPVQELNRVRYWLSYVNYTMGRSYDAAVLGEFVARRYARDEASGNIPLDAAYLAMASYGRAYGDKTNKTKEVDIQRMISICNFITETWPASEKAIEAMLLLGDMYSRIKKPAEAGTWYLRVPENSPAYLDAQLRAGQAYWAAYLTAGDIPEAERPTPEVLAGYQKQAQDILKATIDKSEAKLTDTDPLSSELVFAKLSLAQMVNGSGQYNDAILLLETGKRPVLPMTDVKEGEARPPIGPKSKVFAGEVRRQLLRSYIGLQNLDAAKKQMAVLESMEGAANIGSLYIDLGRQFKDELDRLAKTNKEQYQQVLTSFDKFLANILTLADEGKTYNLLQWVGETYLALAQSITDKGEADRFYAQAAKAFEEILAKGGKDPKFATPLQVASTKFRLVTCKRRAGDFDEALAFLEEIVKERPNALDAQIEGSRLYQDWAGSGQANATELWGWAMLGKPGTEGKPAFWGWADVARRLDRQMGTARGKDRDEYGEQFLDARYNLALSRFKSADSYSATKDQAKQYELALQDITYTTTLRELNDTWYEKFDALHGEIQTAQGVPLTHLDRTKPLPPAEPVAAEAETPAPTKPAAAPAAAKPAEPKSEGGSVLGMLLFGLLCLGGIGGAVYYTMMGSKPKARPRMASTGTPAFAPGPAGPAAASGPAASGPAALGPAAPRPAKPAAASKPAAAKPGEAKPAATKPAAAKPAAPKPAGTQAAAKPAAAAPAKPAAAPKPAAPKPPTEPKPTT